MSNDYYTHSGDFAANTRIGSAANNTKFDAIETGFGLLPAKAKLDRGNIHAYAAGGTANALTVTLDPAITSYADYLAIDVKVATTNTGATSIDVNGLGAKAIKKRGTVSLEAGDLTAGDIVRLVYDGSNFQLSLSASGGLPVATDADVRAMTSGAKTIVPSNLAGMLHQVGVESNAKAWHVNASAWTVNFEFLVYEITHNLGLTADQIDKSQIIIEVDGGYYVPRVESQSTNSFVIGFKTLADAYVGSDFKVLFLRLS